MWRLGLLHPSKVWNKNHPKHVSFSFYFNWRPNWTFLLGTLWWCVDCMKKSNIFKGVWCMSIRHCRCIQYTCKPYPHFQHTSTFPFHRIVMFYDPSNKKSSRSQNRQCTLLVIHRTFWGFISFGFIISFFSGPEALEAGKGGYFGADRDSFADTQEIWWAKVHWGLWGRQTKDFYTFYQISTLTYLQHNQL